MEDTLKQFVSALFMDSWEWLKNKETKSTAIFALEEIFSSNNIVNRVKKGDLAICCKSLAELLLCQLEKQNDMENIKYEKEKMFAIASALNIINDKNYLNKFSNEET